MGAFIGLLLLMVAGMGVQVLAQVNGAPHTPAPPGMPTTPPPNAPGMPTTPPTNAPGLPSGGSTNAPGAPTGPG